MGHDLLIYIVVGFILILQVKVFLKNLYKIYNYKNTIRNSKDFEIIDVQVHENEIDDIDITTLFNRSSKQGDSHAGEEFNGSGVEDLIDEQESVRLPEIGFEDVDQLDAFEHTEDNSSRPKKRAVNDDYDELPF